METEPQQVFSGEFLCTEKRDIVKGLLSGPLNLGLIMKILQLVDFVEQ